MNKAELIDAIADNTGYPKSQVSEVIAEMCDLVVEAVSKPKRGEEPEVNLQPLGKFKLKKSKARTGVNPATGAKIKIPARKSLKFTPSAALKRL